MAGPLAPLDKFVSERARGPRGEHPLKGRPYRGHRLTAVEPGGGGGADGEQHAGVERPAQWLGIRQVARRAIEQTLRRPPIAALEVVVGRGELDQTLEVVAVLAGYAAPAVLPGFMGVPPLAAIEAFGAPGQSGQR